MEDSTDLWLLKRRHEDMSSMFRTCWDLYIKFYTVFLTFSMAAMGLVLTQKAPLPRNVVHVIALVFIGESLLAAATSAFMGIYTRQVARDHARLESAILGAVPAPPSLSATRAIPVSIAIWSGWANALGMVGISYAWAYIAFRMQL